MFNVKKPCEKCPFKKDTVMKLHPDRLPEIVDGLRRDEIFYCHETINYNDQFEEDENGDEKFSTNETNQFCAGAMTFLEKQGIYNKVVQIGKRYDKVSSESLLRNKDKVINTLDERSI